MGGGILDSDNFLGCQDLGLALDFVVQDLNTHAAVEEDDGIAMSAEEVRIS